MICSQLCPQTPENPHHPGCASPPAVLPGTSGSLWGYAPGASLRTAWFSQLFLSVLDCHHSPPPGYRAYLASKRCAQIACSLRKWKEKARIHQISSSGARLEQSPAHTAARYNLLRLTGTTQLLELRAPELQKSEDTGTHASCYKSKVLGDTRVSAGEWSEKDLN